MTLDDELADLGKPPATPDEVRLDFANPSTVAESLPDPFPGEYVLRRRLGEGSFGTVWFAEDLNLGRPVALKTLKVPADSTTGPQALAALKRDAQWLVKVEHPNIVRVYAWRTAGQDPYLVLEYVEGGTLADRLGDGPLEWSEAAHYVADVGAALLGAHALEVIHRDIKPANILWDCRRREAKLTDFGVAARLSEPGTPAGTPNYMAPEAWEGLVSPALDVYGLAATLFHLVTGEVPFPSGSRSELVDRSKRGLPAPDPRLGRVPESLERVIRSGMEPDPGRRPALDLFLEDLRGTLNCLVADTLVPSAADRPLPTVDIRLGVSREVAPDRYEPVSLTPPRRVSSHRDIKRVPRPPEQVRLRSGDRARIEVVVDREGFLTVFNVGPTGTLNLLHPSELTTSTHLVPARRPLFIDVEMSPPPGRERIVAFWSTEPRLIPLERLQSLVEAEPTAGSGSRAYRTTRDLKLIRDAMQQTPTGDWQAAVLEIDHFE